MEICARPRPAVAPGARCSNLQISKSPNPKSRSGISLLEILVSIFILSIGLLGVAALIPIGKLSLVETNKSDRSGMQGRAGLREVKARRMLDPTLLSDPQGRGTVPNVYAIDPLGVVDGLRLLNLGLTSNVGTGPLFPIPRFTLLYGSPPAAPSLTVVEQVFRWHDDLLYEQRADYTPPPAYPNGVRPIPVYDPGLGVNVQGSDPSFSWFLTVSPSQLQPRTYEVSVVSCYKRLLTQTNGQPDGEQAADLMTGAAGFPGLGFGGGTIVLNNPNLSTTLPLRRVKDNQWVMLCGWNPDANNNRIPVRCQWYRVVGVGLDVPAPNGPALSLVGPDWDVGNYQNVTLLVVNGVTGVYTNTVQLDSDEIWTK